MGEQRFMVRFRDRGRGFRRQREMRVDETFQSFVGARRLAAVGRKDPFRRLLRHRVDKVLPSGKIRADCTATNSS